MAKKQPQYDDEDFFSDRRKKSRPLKHSKNLRGLGMRVINSYVEDDDGDVFNNHDYDDTRDHTSFTSRSHYV